MTHRNRTPWLLAIPAGLGLLFLLAPAIGLIWRTPWAELGTQLSSPTVIEALRLSLVCASSATVISVLLGVPLAWLLHRLQQSQVRWLTRLVRALVTVPLVMPPVVGGVALLLVFGRNGLLGGPLFAWTGLSLPFTTAGVIMAETFVAMPFLVVTVEGSLRGLDNRLESAAVTLGAGTWYTFRRVTLPLVWPGILAGAVLAWARALGEFGATITFAGNFPGKTQTMPLAVYLAMQDDPKAAIVLALVLMLVSVVFLALLSDRWLPRGTRSRAGGRAR